MNNVMKIVIIFVYLFVYVASYIMMTKQNRSFYNMTLKEWRYFKWLLLQSFDIKDVWYKPVTVVLSIAFVLLFPVVSLMFPRWDEMNHIVKPEYLTLPYAVHMDEYPYTKTKNMQSKVYWEQLFRKHDIHTPRIYCTSPNSCVHIPNTAQLLSKPIFGTQGAGIVENTTVENYAKTENCILQEQLTDCYVPKSKRHFRIVTRIDGTVFYTREFKHPRKRFEGVICSKFKCSETLTTRERKELRTIKAQLKRLHTNEFKFVPFIGWDVMLTCKGAYALEGNLGATITVPSLRKKYVQYMRSLYSTVC